MAGPIETFRAKAQRAVIDSALALAGLTPQARPMPLEDRAGRWWDVQAKYDYAKRVYDEERARFAGHSNDGGDAMRHAEASRRLAQAAGPVFADVAGFGHELVNLRRSLLTHGPTGRYDRGPVATPGQTVDEMGMDLRNNAEGRRAAREGRAVDPARLQKAPDTPGYARLYRSPPAELAGRPPR